MFHRINQKIYGIAGLFLLLVFVSYVGLAIFLDHQTKASEEGVHTRFVPKGVPVRIVSVG